MYHLRGGEVVSDPGGVDRVGTLVSWVLAPGIEHAVAENPDAPINLTGNNLSNELGGNHQANVLIGGDGNDTLVGHRRQ